MVADGKLLGGYLEQVIRCDGPESPLGYALQIRGPSLSEATCTNQTVNMQFSNFWEFPLNASYVGKAAPPKDSRQYHKYEFWMDSEKYNFYADIVGDKVRPVWQGKVFTADPEHHLFHWAYYAWVAGEPALKFFEPTMPSKGAVCVNISSSPLDVEDNNNHMGLLIAPLRQHLSIRASNRRHHQHQKGSSFPIPKIAEQFMMRSLEIDDTLNGSVVLRQHFVSDPINKRSKMVADGQLVGGYLEQVVRCDGPEAPRGYFVQVRGMLTSPPSYPGVVSPSSSHPQHSFDLVVFSNYMTDLDKDRGIISKTFDSSGNVADVKVTPAALWWCVMDSAKYTSAISQQIIERREQQEAKEKQQRQGEAAKRGRAKGKKVRQD